MDKNTPEYVRDEMERCFLDAHLNELNELTEGISSSNDPENSKKEIEKQYVNALIRGAFSKTNGNYDKPTKEDIYNVLSELKDFASNFRSQEVVHKNYNKIKELADNLK